MEAPLLEANIWQAYKDRGVMVFAINNQSYQVSTAWTQQYHLTYPVLYDPPPSTYFWMYLHGYIPQNTVTDRNFVVVYDAYGYNQSAIINAIQSRLNDVSVVMSAGETSVYPGEDLVFDVTLKNWGTQAHTFNVWLDGIFPNHTPVPMNPIKGPVTVTLQPGQEISPTVTLRIPAGAPPGENYRLKTSVGVWPDDIQNCDLLRFDILEP